LNATLYRRRSRLTFVASIMLVAFASRALIPPGFMPASSRPFPIEICWEDFPAGMLGHGESMGGAHHHHPGSPAHSDHCVFGTACSAGPIPHLPQANDVLLVRQLRAVELVSAERDVRLVHLPQPRAPPGRLS
jgi:hypothetical protein